MADLQAQRQANSTRAWKKAIDHLCKLAGHRGCRSTPDTEAALEAAEKASAAYVTGDKNANAGKALARYQAAVEAVIKADAPVDRECRTCGSPDATIVLIASDGDAECSKCRRGANYGATEGAADSL
jgi:nucleotide-binding universal stress UspA family protein